MKLTNYFNSIQCDGCSCFSATSYSMSGALNLFKQIKPNLDGYIQASWKVPGNWRPDIYGLVG